MPIFAENILHGNARTLGILMGAAGLGAMTGALLLAGRSRIQGLGRWVATSGAGFGVSLICFSFSRWFPLSVALLVPVGFCAMVELGACNTLIQAMVPDRLRGRIMALYSMMFMGMVPLGALLSGFLADHIGADWTVAIGGIGAILGAIAFGRHLPKLRVETRQLLTAQGMTTGATIPD